MAFFEFVAIKLRQTSDKTTDYKAMASFINSVREYSCLDPLEQLKIWIVNMIDKGLTPGSRKRYIEKISALYRLYSVQNDDAAGNPFDKINELRDFEVHPAAKDIPVQAEALGRVFDRLMFEAKTKPELAVFLYMLFNASSDMERAVSLTTAEYTPDFPQLDDFIRIDEFHHRRKYVFDLGQSRKRMPQIVREVTDGIYNSLSLKGIKFAEKFTQKTISALWAAKAKEAGVKLGDVKCVLKVIPDEYEYLRFVKCSELSSEEIERIKRLVAESFYPSGKRWYAIKLRRGVAYNTFQKFVKENLGECYDEHMLFYPQEEISKRVDKKIMTEEMPVIPNVVFFLVRPRHVNRIDSLVRAENLGWVFRTVNTARGDYSVISHKSMSDFQHVIGIFTPDIKIELTKESPVCIGRDVRITGGIMAGYTGTIYDIKEGSDVRQIYIRLSKDYFVKAEVKVDEFYVKTIDKAS